MFEIKVDFNQSGQRIDRLFRKEFKDLPLSKIFGLFRKKKVRLNGARAKGDEILQQDDLIQIYENIVYSKPVVEVGWGAKPTRLLFDVIYEDSHYLICNKYSGVAVQPGSGVPIGESLIENVWAYLGHNNAQLAHRLDKGTSGVIAIGKDGPSIRSLTDHLRSRRVEKIYFAIVAGRLEKSGTIRLKLDRIDAATGSKMQISKSGLESVTHYKSISFNDQISLVQVQLETGRMHQIRAHMAHIGHPLIGDDRYGDFEVNRQAKKQWGLKRLCLHALELKIPGFQIFEAPLPQEWQDITF